MTTNMQNMLDQAFEAGRAAERKMAELYTAQAIYNAPAPAQTMTRHTAPTTGKSHARMLAEEPKATVAHVVARGVKKGGGAPRTKGVKGAIVKLISTGIPGGLTTADIIQQTGFKPTSVNSTLMTLKKDGIASQDGKFWFLASGPHGNGSSDDIAATMD